MVSHLFDYSSIFGNMRNDVSLSITVLERKSKREVMFSSIIGEITTHFPHSYEGEILLILSWILRFMPKRFL